MPNAKEGDCFVSLADEHGIRDYRTLWDENKPLHASRPNPNMLVPGDTIKLPAATKVVKKSTDQNWTFVVVPKKPVSLRIILTDRDLKPAKGLKWTLESPVKKSGKTGKDGLIEIKDFPPHEKSAVLKVKLEKAKKSTQKTPPKPVPDPGRYPPLLDADEFTDPKPADADLLEEVVWTLKIGSLPSFNDRRGVQARLHNLGSHITVGADDPKTSAAVKHYQRVFLNQKKGSGVATDIEADLRDRHDKP